MLCWFSTSSDWNREPCLNDFCGVRFHCTSGSSLLPNSATLCPNIHRQTIKIGFLKQKNEMKSTVMIQTGTVWWNLPVPLIDLFRQGRLWENISSVWCFWSLTWPSYFRKPSNLLKLPHRPAGHWTHAFYTYRHTYTQTHTSKTGKYSNNKKNTNNKPAGSSFFPSCLLSLSLALFIKPTFRCFLKINPFLQCSLQIIHTYTQAQNMRFFLKTRLRHFSKTPFCYKNPEIRTRMLTHCVFCRLPCWPPGS